MLDLNKTRRSSLAQDEEYTCDRRLCSRETAQGLAKIIDWSSF
jgi:hypothetical protein